MVLPFKEPDDDSVGRPAGTWKEMEMADPNPASGMPLQFQKYWLTGAGGAAIAWDTPGDFDRCRKLINAKIEEHGGKPLPPNEISGLCNILHRKATGAAPGHGPAESHMGKH